MPSVNYGRISEMSGVAKEERLTPEEEMAVLYPFSNPKAFKSLWVKGAARAQKKAVEENDRLGLDSHGTVDGRLAVKNPSGTVSFVKNFDV